MNLQGIIGDFGLVIKVNVSDLKASLDWYQTKLHLVHDPRYDTPAWAQVNIPPIHRVAIGLNADAGGVGSGGEVTTFVVDDIVAARDALIKEGVQVGKIEEVPHGVKLAFFKDLDGNSLGLRQNPPDHPKAVALGA